MKPASFATLLLAIVPAGLSAGQADNSLVWGYDTQLETMNPYATNKGKAQLVMRNVLEHLLYRANDGSARPALATQWTWVDDVTIDFTLREGVTFSNGEAFDADDVVFTVNLVKDPESKISAQATTGSSTGLKRPGNTRSVCTCRNRRPRPSTA